MSGQQHACVGILLTAVCAISSVGSSAQPHCCCCQQRAPLQDGCAEVLLLPPRCRLAVEKRVGTMLELLQDDDERIVEEVRLSATEEQNARHALEVLLGSHDGDGKRRERHTRETLKETLVHLAKERY